WSWRRSSLAGDAFEQAHRVALVTIGGTRRAPGVNAVPWRTAIVPSWWRPGDFDDAGLAGLQQAGMNDGLGKTRTLGVLVGSPNAAFTFCAPRHQVGLASTFRQICQATDLFRRECRLILRHYRFNPLAFRRL